MSRRRDLAEELETFDASDEKVLEARNRVIKEQEDERLKARREAFEEAMATKSGRLAIGLVLQTIEPRENIFQTNALAMAANAKLADVHKGLCKMIAEISTEHFFTMLREIKEQ